MKMWDDVTAEMMTEEEMGSENNYIRRRQSWRSLEFNELMDKLDEDRNSGRLSLARPRDLGFRRFCVALSTSKCQALDDHTTYHQSSCRRE